MEGKTMFTPPTDPMRSKTNPILLCPCGYFGPAYTQGLDEHCPKCGQYCGYELNTAHRLTPARKKSSRAGLLVGLGMLLVPIGTVALLVGLGG
jgi:hypothetical protein